VTSLRSPRSKTMRVVLGVLLGSWCWTRNAREGTVLRAERDTGWMNCHSGRVKWPAERAWSVTVVLEDIRKVASSIEQERKKKGKKSQGL
jgi:hypothetical protein